MIKIIEKIKEYDKIIIIMHIRPDGDCYGSGFGLKQAILDNFGEKEIYVLGEPLENKSHLGVPDIVEDKTFKDALVISIDTGNRVRIADKRFDIGDFLIRIDHHVHIDYFGDIDYVDTSAPATSFIIAKTLIQHNLIISKKTAECLYTGIMTDTGRMRYRGVSKETFNIVSKLISTGIDQQELLQKLYKRTLSEFKLEGEVLNQIKTIGNVIYATIPRTLIEKYKLEDPVVAEFVKLMEDYKGYPIWVLFYETKKDVRCRIRSKGIAIDKIANKYGGGGHSSAAGIMFQSWDDIQPLLEDLEKAAL